MKTYRAGLPPAMQEEYTLAQFYNDYTMQVANLILHRCPRRSTNSLGPNSGHPSSDVCCSCTMMRALKSSSVNCLTMSTTIMSRPNSFEYTVPPTSMTTLMPEGYCQRAVSFGT